MTQEGYIPDEIPAKFWAVIDEVDSDPKKMRVALETMSRDELNKFFWNYEEAVAQIKPLYYDLSEFSESSIDEICYWVVAQGKAEYRILWDDAEEVIPDTTHRFGILRSDPGLVSEIYDVYDSKFNESPPTKNDDKFHE